MHDISDTAVILLHKNPDKYWKADCKAQAIWKTPAKGTHGVKRHCNNLLQNKETDTPGVSCFYSNQSLLLSKERVEIISDENI
ncbi:hypothetical protein UY3_08635 [Chelonia mydas]|uniref:Uncharacterized protein n=1 Tax=Chelonia mydas TaxID=8469 RepID=M7B8C0_CHEMY|nr:hypothetical protein UY3_08635 [Chelonia mydas]